MEIRHRLLRPYPCQNMRQMYPKQFSKKPSCLRLAIDGRNVPVNPVVEDKEKPTRFTSTCWRWSPVISSPNLGTYHDVSAFGIGILLQSLIFLNALNFGSSETTVACANFDMAIRRFKA